MTQTDLAQLAGTSRESVSRFLATLERAGVVSVGRGSVTVLEPRRLRAYIFWRLPDRLRPQPGADGRAPAARPGSPTSGCWRPWRGAARAFRRRAARPARLRGLGAAARGRPDHLPALGRRRDLRRARAAGGRARARDRHRARATRRLCSPDSPPRSLVSSGSPISPRARAPTSLRGRRRCRADRDPRWRRHARCAPTQLRSTPSPSTRPPRRRRRV